MTAPTSKPGVLVCFQFVTKGNAVVDTSPEEFPTMAAATKRAEEWMNLTPSTRTLSFTTYEGDGAVIRSGEIEHIAVMPAKKMATIYEQAVQAAQEEGFPNA